MNTLHLTDKQLEVVEKALEFYARIGIGQFTEIKDHPTFENHIENMCRPNKTPDVGDSTAQGKILEIDTDNEKALINGSVKNGRWCKDKEWKPLSEVVLSPDYTKYHELRDKVDNALKDPRNMLIGEDIPTNGSWGINHKNVDETCQIAMELKSDISRLK